MKEQPNITSSRLNLPTGKLSIWWKLSLIIIIPLDILAVANWLGAAPCLGGKLDKCTPLKPEIIIVAIVLTAILLYKYYKTHPRPFAERGNPKIGWAFAIFLWWSITFFGEAFPQLAGIWRGVPAGEYGYHFGLLDNPLAWIETGMIWDIIVMGLLGVFGVVLYRFLYWPVAGFIGATVAAALEFSLFNEGASFDTYNPNIDLFGTIIFLLSTWLIYFFISFGLWNLISSWWGKTGRVVAIVVIILANFSASAYFAYIRTIDPKAKQGSPGSQVELLPQNTCPDQILYNDGPLVYYKDGKEMSPGTDESVNWVNQNCPGSTKNLRKTKIA